MRPLLVLAFATGLCAQDRPAVDASPLNGSERIAHVLSRLTFGATPQLVAEIRAQGLESWLDTQLATGAQEPQLLTDRLAGMGSLGLGCTSLVQTYRAPAEGKTAEARAERERLRNVPGRETRDAVLLRAAFGANQVREVLADFFRNHFNVCVQKDDVRYLLPDWEREVIRAEALGTFPALLQKSAHHPAMLIYLDNSLSRRPLTAAEVRAIGLDTRLRTRSRARGQEAIDIAKQRGLNENYARELLELHTLGVDNGYVQKDVSELARILTGWSVDLSAKEGTGFCFRADMHCDKDKIVLGRTIEHDRKHGQNEGEQVLEMLAAHPGTARFVAWKLCRHLVADEPQESLVERIASVFRQTKGNVPAMVKAIVASPEFFAPAAFQGKFKRPFELVICALRATHASVDSTEGLHRWLAQLGEPIYGCDDPTGYYDQAEAWCDPGVMAVRWRFAQDLAQGRIPGVRIGAAVLEGLHPQIVRAWPEQLAARLLPAGMSARTRAVLDQALQAHLAGRAAAQPRALGPLLVGLLLASPEFQRQ